MKLITKFYLIIILSSLFLFSCGKCGGIFKPIIEGEQPISEGISFSFIQPGFDSTDIFYNGLSTENDLELFVINDDNTIDTLEFYMNTDYANKKRIAYPTYIFNDDNLGDFKIEFRLDINSEEFIIPISFTKTRDSQECRKGDTHVSNIIIDNPGHTIINTEYNFPNPFTRHHAIIIVPRTKTP